MSRPTRLVLGALALALAVPAAARRTNYPPAPRAPHTDLYPGDELADPYRWLETAARDTEEVPAWDEAPTEVTYASLRSSKQREAI
mgnify:CR=1 FL=1